MTTLWLIARRAAVEALQDRLTLMIIVFTVVLRLIAS